MEHNNIYVYHRGIGESTLGKPILFVFPYSENLTTNAMKSFMESEFTKRAEMDLQKVQIRCGSVGDQVLKKDVVQHKSKSAVLLPSYYHNGRTSCHTYLLNSSFLAHYGNHRKNKSIKSKMDAMIKLYEGIVNKQSATEANSTLEANDIIYYDAQKLAGPKRFDKRSPEGKALISAKRIVQHEKLLAQRGHSINAKHRERSIDKSRLELQDNERQ